MMLTDAGPLIAVIDRADSLHLRAVSFLRSLRESPFVTTWPCLSEAMHILAGVGGHGYQTPVWTLRDTNRLIILDLTSGEVDRMIGLMAKYHDRPMDLADASLVAVAEARGFKQIFTFDSDFRVYRLADGTVLDVVPH